MQEGYLAVFNLHQHGAGIDPACNACVLAAEAALMRTAAAWERFVFDLLVDLMAGRQTRHNHKFFCSPRASHPSRTAAETELLRTLVRNGNVHLRRSPGHYLLLHDPSKIIVVAEHWLDSSPVAATAQRRAVEIRYFLALRHAIAHGTAHARNEARSVMLHFEPLRTFHRIGQFLLHRSNVGSPTYLETFFADIFGWCQEMSP